MTSFVMRHAALAGFAAGVFIAPSAAANYLDDPKRIADYALAHARPLDWKTVFAGPERLIYLGERHPDARPKVELIGHLREAAAQGVTVLGLEMLGEDRRDLLDRFARGAATEAEMAGALSEDWGSADRGFMPAAYARVLTAARQAGLKIEPLDFPVADKQKAWEICIARKTEEQCEDDALRARDAKMGESLARILSGGGDRVLAWMGAWHACSLQQPAALRAEGFASRSYYVLTKGRYERDAGLIHYVDTIEKSGWKSRKVLIPTEGVQACFAGLIYEPDADVAPARR